MQMQLRKIGVRDGIERGGIRWMIAGVLILALVLLVGTKAEGAQGKTRTVPTSPGCDTIQSCVAASNAGDTIRILAGEYRENVTVDKDLTIEGSDCKDRSKVIVDAEPGGIEGIGFNVTADGVTIRCLSVRNGVTGIQGGDSVTPVNNLSVGRVVVEGPEDDNILVTGDDLLVQNSRLIASGDHSLELIGNGGRIINAIARGSDSDCFQLDGDNNSVQGSYFDRCEDGAGIDISGVDNRVSGNTVVGSQEGIEVTGEAPQVVGNTTQSTSDEGFDLECDARCEDGLIQDNLARRSVDDDEGFEIDTTAPGLRILDNVAEDNIEDGFELGTVGAIVRGNVARFSGSEGSNEGHGFNLEGSDNLFEENRAFRSKRDGFFLNNGDNNVFRNNISEANSKDGFDLNNTTSSDNVLRGNTATDNRAEGFENNALLTDVIGNQASANRIDCANDGTIDQKQNNRCADGSNFNVPPEVE